MLLDLILLFWNPFVIDETYGELCNGCSFASRCMIHQKLHQPSTEILRLDHLVISCQGLLGTSLSLPSFRRPKNVIFWPHKVTTLGSVCYISMWHCSSLVLSFTSLPKKEEIFLQSVCWHGLIMSYKWCKLIFFIVVGIFVDPSIVSLIDRCETIKL